MIVRRGIKVLSYALLATGTFFAGLVSFGAREHKPTNKDSSLLIPEAHADIAYGISCDTSCGGCYTGSTGG